MRLIRKIFNKILFASVVGIVFALFNRCEVKAYGYFQTSASSFTSNGTINYHSDYNELFTNVAYGGSAFQYGCENSTPSWEQLVVNNNVYYANSPSWKFQCFYILQNKNNSNSYAWGANKVDSSGSEDGRKPTSMFMYHVFPDNNTYDFVIIQSYAGSQNTTSNYMIYYEDTPPILTNQGSSTYRLTATSKTYILHYRQGFNYNSDMGYNWSNYPWIYYLDLELDTDEYFETSHSSTRAPLQDLYTYGSNGVDKNFNYYATEVIQWNTNNNNQDEFPSVERTPSITFSPNYVKVNNLYVAVNILVKVLDYNFTDYKYYYSFVSEEDSEDIDYNTLEYTELFEQNFLILDSEADTTLHFDHNGYLFMKIVDISNNEVVYSTSTHISALSTKEPDIDININYNSGNSTTIDEILIDTDYNIYSSNLTGYKCYYLFSNIEIEPTTNDFIETDCSAGRLYVAHNNGYYYARITYNDEIVADVVRNISEYGQLVSTIYSDYSNNIFNKLLGGTNGYLSIFTNNKGPLYSLVSLPLRLGTFIYNFFNSSNFCTPYDFGTIFGQHFTIGCINLSVLGSPLLQTIDTIFAGFFTITWGLFLYKLLRKMILLKDISITGLFKGGIF